MSNYELSQNRPLEQEDGKQKHNPRYNTELGIKYCGSRGERKAGVIRKISVSGVCLESNELLAENEEITFFMPFSSLDGSESGFQLKGRIIVHSSSSPYQYQAVFQDLDEDEKASLVELIADLLINQKAHSANKKE